jgi:hypothetical protein
MSNLKDLLPEKFMDGCTWRVFLATAGNLLSSAASLDIWLHVAISVATLSYVLLKTWQLWQRRKEKRGEQEDLDL